MRLLGRILLFIAAPMLVIAGCTYKNKHFALSEDDKMWLHVDSVMIYTSDRGNLDSTILKTDNISFAVPNGKEVPFDLFSDDKSNGRYEASIIQRIVNRGGHRYINMHIRKTRKDNLDIYMSFEFSRSDTTYYNDEFDIRFINRQLSPKSVKINGKTYKDCLVIDSWDSDSLFYYDRSNNHIPPNNMEKVIWNKGHGLIYYKLENGEEFIRKFD